LTVRVTSVALFLKPGALKGKGIVFAGRVGDYITPHVGGHASDFDCGAGYRSLAGIGDETDDGTEFELRQRRGGEQQQEKDRGNKAFHESLHLVGCDRYVAISDGRP
jgi:hypothetical protein